MEKRIQLNSYSVNIQFLEFQKIDPARPILIFLHEALGSIAQWKSFPIQLCENLKLPGLIIERSGHGLSDALQEPRTEKYLHNYAHETEQVFRELFDTKQPLVLVGHSDGGTIALLLTTRSNFNIIGGVTMAAHTFVEEETIAGIQPAVEAFEAGKLDGLYRIHGDKTTELFYAWANTWKSSFFRNWDIRDEIKQINRPFLVIQGEEDQYGTVEQVNSIVHVNKKAQKLLLRNCGHHPHLEKPMEVLLAIHAWYMNNIR